MYAQLSFLSNSILNTPSSQLSGIKQQAQSADFLTIYLKLGASKEGTSKDPHIAYRDGVSLTSTLSINEGKMVNYFA
jgi:hypothetical protein